MAGLGIAAFLAVLSLSFSATRQLAASYEKLKGMDLNTDFSEAIFYDDRLYAVIGHGIIMDETVRDRETFFSSFLNDSLRSIDARILSAGVIYVMMISAFFAYPLLHRYPNDRKKQISAAIVTADLLYLVYYAFVAGVRLICKVPFYFPKENLAILIAGVLSLIGGLCALILLIRKIRFQKAAAILAIPLLLGLFLLSFLCEAGLFSAKTIESFEYIADIDPRILDENFTDFNYDEEKNVVVIEDKEYPPEQTDNPDHFKGLAGIAAILSETASPYAGSALPMIKGEFEAKIPAAVLLLYVLKSFFWIFLSAYEKKECYR